MDSKYFPTHTFISMGEVLGFGWAEQEIRARAVRVAEAMIGHGPGSQVYRDMCWPGDTKEDQIRLESSNANDFFAAGIMRCLGCRHPLLDPPYFGRTDSRSRLKRIAKEQGGWKGHDTVPESGDIVLMGVGTSISTGEDAMLWGSPAHSVVVVNRFIEDDKMILSVVEGYTGGVREAEYEIKSFVKEKWLSDWTTRRIYGVIKISELRLQEPWCMPIVEQ